MMDYKHQMNDIFAASLLLPHQPFARITASITSLSWPGDFLPVIKPQHNMTASQNTDGDVSLMAHGFATLAVHAGAPIDPVTGAVIDPVSCVGVSFELAGSDA